jgi:hypothetical protein
MKRQGFIAWLGLDRPEETRPCPHCDATIALAQNVCPSCHRILRYEGIEELRRLRGDKRREAA